MGYTLLTVASVVLLGVTVTARTIELRKVLTVKESLPYEEMNEHLSKKLIDEIENSKELAELVSELVDYVAFFHATMGQATEAIEERTKELIKLLAPRFNK